MSCFGEYLADCAADGVDIAAPVPLSARSRARMRNAENCPARMLADEYATQLAGEETTETEGKRVGVCAPDISGHSPAT